MQEIHLKFRKSLMQLYKGATLCPIFGLFLWNRQNKWEIGGQELQNARLEKAINWEE